jgi:hypothetical protein
MAWAIFLVAPAMAEDTLPVAGAEISVNELAAMTGLDIYKCRVYVKKGERLRGVLYLKKDEASEPMEALKLESEARSDGEASFLASFLREDGKLASLFLSNEPKMYARFRWTGAASGGLTGYVDAPLADISDKAITVHPTPKQMPDGSSEIFLLYRTENKGRGLELLYPQVSLRVEMVK